METSARPEGVIKDFVETEVFKEEFLVRHERSLHLIFAVFHHQYRPPRRCLRSCAFKSAASTGRMGAGILACLAWACG
jgi:hypothetical protein